MKLDVISDLHLGESEGVDVTKISKLLPKKSTILVLAGDIAKVNDAKGWASLSALLGVASQSYSLIIYVIGNHEYYSDGLGAESDSIAIFNRLKSLEKVFPKLHILENSWCLDKAEKVMILGATGWTDVSPNAFQTKLPIFNYSTYTGRCKSITRSQWQATHFSFRSRLEEAIEFSKVLGYKLVVITHYAPVFNEALDPKYHGDKKNEMYCTDLSSYFKDVHTWVFGHTGYNCNYYVNKDQLGSSNPLSPPVKGTHIYSNQYEVSTGPKYSTEPLVV